MPRVKKPEDDNFTWEATKTIDFDRLVSYRFSAAVQNAQVKVDPRVKKYHEEGFTPKQIAAILGVQGWEIRQQTSQMLPVLRRTYKPKGTA